MECTLFDLKRTTGPSHSRLDNTILFTTCFSCSLEINNLILQMLRSVLKHLALYFILPDSPLIMHHPYSIWIPNRIDAPLSWRFTPLHRYTVTPLHRYTVHTVHTMYSYRAHPSDSYYRSCMSAMNFVTPSLTSPDTLDRSLQNALIP